MLMPIAGVSFHNLFRQSYTAEALKITCLKDITLDSGLARQTVFVDYDMDSARLENGSFAAGTAVVSPVREDGSFGQTVYTYFNGSSPSRVTYPLTDSYCNVADFYSHFEGQLKSSASYDGDHVKITESNCCMKAFDTHGFCIQQTKSKIPVRLEEMGEAAETAVMQVMRWVIYMRSGGQGKGMYLSWKVRHLAAEKAERAVQRVETAIIIMVKKDR